MAQFKDGTFDPDKANEKYHEIRVLERAFRDVQAVRLQFGNRITAAFYTSHGVAPGEQADKINEEGAKLLKQMKAAYDKLTKGLARFPSKDKFKPEGVIDSYVVLVMVRQWDEQMRMEKEIITRLADVMKDYKIYTDFLEPIRGVGPAMASAVMSNINIFKARYPSSLFKYSGYDVVEDPKEPGKMIGRSRRKDLMGTAEYRAADGTTKTKPSLGYNPVLKTHLHNLAESFLKQPADKCKYREIYDDYKHRLDNSPAHQSWYDVYVTEHPDDSKLEGAHVKLGNWNNITMGQLTAKGAPVAEGEKGMSKAADLISYESRALPWRIQAALAAIASGEDVNALSRMAPGNEDWVSTLPTDKRTEFAKHVQVVMTGKTQAHRHMMAMRYIKKQFLIDLYMAWRPIEGLEVLGTYAEDKLGIVHRPHMSGAAA